MNRFIRFMMLDSKLLAKSKVFYLKLILLPLLLIFILGSLFGHSGSTSFSAHSHSEQTIPTLKAGFSLPKEYLVTETKSVQPIQYEVIAMMVLFSILTAFELAHSLVRDKLNHTINRVITTPTTPLQYVLGKSFGVTLAIVLQMGIVMLSSWMIFQVNWVNIPMVICTTLLYGLAVGSIVFICGILAKNHASISSYSALVLYGLGFLGGSFFNKDQFPPALKSVQEWTPNGQAINVYVDLFQGASTNIVLTDTIKLAAVAAIFLGAAITLARKKMNR